MNDFIILEMKIEDIAESAVLLCEAYEKDAILCTEKPNIKDISSSLTDFLKNENVFMYIYKENKIIKGVCGFMIVPSIVDYTCIQAIEVANNPLYSLNKVAKTKIFIRMIERMEEVMSEIKVNDFLMSIPTHFKGNKNLKRKGYKYKENLFVKEIN